MKKLKGIKPEDVVFINIEKSRILESLEEGSIDYRMWKHKHDYAKFEGTVNESFQERAANYPEYSRLECITVGMIRDNRLIISTYQDEDERLMLDKFNRDLNHIYKRNPSTKICGYTSKQIDLPFVFKRSMINGVCPCELIDVGGFERWHIDTIEIKELWKGTGLFGSSIKEISYSLGIDVYEVEEINDLHGYKLEEGGKGLIRDISEIKLVSIAKILKRFIFEPDYSEIEKRVPKEYEEEGLIEKISRTGIIEESEKEKILELASGFGIDEKELLLENLNAALARTKKEVDRKLRLEILKA